MKNILKGLKSIIMPRYKEDKPDGDSFLYKEDKIDRSGKTFVSRKGYASNFEETFPSNVESIITGTLEEGNGVIPFVFQRSPGNYLVAKILAQYIKLKDKLEITLEGNIEMDEKGKPLLYVKNVTY